ncbi:transcriptional repressor [Rhodococcus sp. X156]|uniref:Fur family transcriptional regulator n=1 Tax=Rhodococcus sp. X156 TaxID=2499145 RepID=UPI001F49E6E1|nr:transcriptional repressor [Rhodococcus sp. X156]
MRMTPQRQMVLDAVRTLGHATPEAICAEVQQQSPAVNISTVYRTLDLLEQIGLVRHTHLGHGAPTYSCDPHEHVHLVCHSCQQVIEVEPELLEPLAATLAATRGFTLDPAHLALSGQCANCASQPAPADQPVPGQGHTTRNPEEPV